MKASAHWIIPDENEAEHGQFAWATVAEAKAAWHCRNREAAREFFGLRPQVNSRSLGVEIVNRISGDAEDLYSAPYQNLDH